ncbi:PhzF family phenazine biosynthesis protein [Murinocardiopsis flavida]|uniref:PhzF family phenazine biosynthesis protein n=1 Tax=Murinocardiopsis flavida TaxID=645275 RepID=A0A2P8DH08_9ACTN|nr:PhzF family phenazine biosynthesis protein [Murinocardiopsis flavida]PSK96488.1 PhzF family phenazine biosynthesis protein [Murinocardiopsis flavida]
MPARTTLHVVTVFLGDDDQGGNPLGVFLYAGRPPAEQRQRIAADLGFSETVFVADPATAELTIHTPANELPLAGHPLVGTAWLLDREGHRVSTLRPPAGEVTTWSEAGRTWFRADPDWAPEFATRQFDAPADVDALTADDGGAAGLHAWAWEDEAAGRVRVRLFAHDLGVVEDEATGSAAMRLCAQLGRPLVIRQGVGSRIDAVPGPGGTVDIGGRVAYLETRDYPVG